MEDVRTEGGLRRKRSWRGVRNTICIKFEVKKRSHIEPESLLQEFGTNNAAKIFINSDLSALILNGNIVDVCTSYLAWRPCYLFSMLQSPCVDQ